MKRLNKILDSDYRTPMIVLAVSVVSLCLLFAGCKKKAPTPQPSQIIVSANDIKTIFGDLGMIADQIDADTTYTLPTLSWIRTDFTKSWQTFVGVLGNWTSEENDCDDYSRMCAAFASLQYHNTPRKEKNCGFAFGEFWYQKKGMGAHAINCGLARQDGTTNVVYFFFEPQPSVGGLVDLTQAEIQSCTLRKF